MAENERDFKGILKGLNIIKLYEKSTQKVPILKYSWVFIATICILSLIGYLKLQKGEVFIYTLLVLFISFLGFIFSYIIKSSTNKYIRILLNLFITCIVVLMCSIIIGFGLFIFTGRPAIFNFSINQSKNLQSSSNILPFTVKLHSILYKIEFNSSLCDVLTYELGPDSCLHVKYNQLSVASECSGADIRYYWRSLSKSKLKGEFYNYLYKHYLFAQIYLDGYVTYFFQENKLTRISIRFVPKNNQFDSSFIATLIEGTSIPNKPFITENINGIHYVVGSSFQDGHLFELFISNDQGYSSCIHDWWRGLQ